MEMSTSRFPHWTCACSKVHISSLDFWIFANENLIHISSNYFLPDFFLIKLFSIVEYEIPRILFPLMFILSPSLKVCSRFFFLSPIGLVESMEGRRFVLVSLFTNWESALSNTLIVIPCISLVPWIDLIFIILYLF